MPESTVQRISMKRGWLQRLLAQVAPAAATDVLLYTPPSGVSNSCVTLIVVCNTGAATTFRLHHNNASSNPATAAVGNALHYDDPIAATGAANCTRYLPPAPEESASLRISAGGGLFVRSASGGVTFSAYGYEEVP